MEKYVSYDKLSKKAQKEYNNKQRQDWGEINPCTKVVPNKKYYNRNRDKASLNHYEEE